MICGHDRETLQWACAQSSPMIAEWSTNEALAESERGRAMSSVVDPAKFAAIIAELMRNHGMYVGTTVDPNATRDCAGARDSYANSVKVWIRPKHGSTMRPLDIELTMPQSRAFALRLVDAPTTTAQDISRMIGEL